MYTSSCRPKTVAIKTIGCRTNQEEMVSLRFHLENAGYLVLDTAEDADIIIFNTCAVTAATESKTKRLLHMLSSVNPDSRILVTGCLAQQKPAELKNMTNVRWVVGNTHKDEIVSILTEEEGIFHSSFDEATDRLKIDLVNYITPPSNSASAKTRFPVKIQEGCDFRCAYCIVPSLRGPNRSVEPGEVLQTAIKAIQAGYKELVLTGTHIGQYGKEHNETIVGLLKKMISIEGDFRIRLSSLDPRDLTDDLIELVENTDCICDHLHVSVQSLSGDVLEKMNRPYEDLDTLIERLISFRKNMPFAGLGADFIVGFPGESESNFFETIDIVNEIGFSYAHIFRYSIRPGTAAAVLPEQISESEKTRRSEILRNVIDESRRLFLKRMRKVNKKIIIESEFPVRGLTSNYLHVEIPNFKGTHNTWLDVSVTESNQGRFCLAEPVECEVI